MSGAVLMILVGLLGMALGVLYVAVRWLWKTLSHESVIRHATQMTREQVSPRHTRDWDW